MLIKNFFSGLTEMTQNRSSDSTAILSGFVCGPLYVAFSSLGRVGNHSLWDLLRPVNLHTGRLVSGPLLRTPSCQVLWMLQSLQLTADRRRFWFLDPQSTVSCIFR